MHTQICVKKGDFWIRNGECTNLSLLPFLCHHTTDGGVTSMFIKESSLNTTVHIRHALYIQVALN